MFQAKNKNSREFSKGKKLLSHFQLIVSTAASDINVVKTQNKTQYENKVTKSTKSE